MRLNCQGVASDSKGLPQSRENKVGEDGLLVRSTSNSPQERNSAILTLRARVRLASRSGPTSSQNTLLNNHFPESSHSDLFPCTDLVLMETKAFTTRRTRKASFLGRVAGWMVGEFCPSPTVKN